MVKNTINIAVCNRTEGTQLQQIAAVDRRLTVRDAFPYLRAELSQRYLYSLGQAKKEEDISQEEARAKMDEIMKDTEIIYSGVYLPPDLHRRAPNLRWIQRAGAGVERVIEAGYPDDKVMVTSASGVGAISIAEHIFCLMLMFTRKGERWMLNKNAKKWERYPSAELYGKTLGIIGLGNIGSRVASLGKAFGMKVLAIKRSAKGRLTSVEGVDELMPPGDLDYLLSQSDYVVISVPATGETTRLINEASLKQMKAGAYLFNISRGAVIDEPALIRALKDRRIAGAGLDVFETEPLPADSDIWGMDNVILTPHIAGVFDNYTGRAVQLFCDNIKRYINGEKLVNMVDIAAGY